MKRKLFIGSSKEGQSIADQVKNQIEKECGAWLNAESWSDGNVFSLNNSALHSLVIASRKFDYGVLVASKDDILHSRGADHFVPRDNVMFEMGMFLGSLGLTRAFLLVEEESKLPTDYNGVTVSYFQRSTPHSLEKAIDQIVKSINGTQSTFNLKPMPSAALALGYFDNLVQPLAKKLQEEGKQFQLEILIPQHLKSIDAEINAYKSKNKSYNASPLGEGKRPILLERNDKPGHYWDIPTTLATLGKLMDLLLPSSEIGINQEKRDWIDHELRNFAGTLDMLIKECPACRDNILVLQIN